LDDFCGFFCNISSTENFELHKVLNLKDALQIFKSKDKKTEHIKCYKLSNKDHVSNQSELTASAPEHV
jgi:hypothetical protein